MTNISIAGGGGGIPVVYEGNELVVIEAVIDKDLASGVLAKMVQADYLMLLTGVDKVSINYKKPDERQLDIINAAEAEMYLAEGQFPEGSMGPKIRAALEFVRGGGKKAIITSLDNIFRLLKVKRGLPLSTDV